jgi:hypothetical protein
MTSPARAKYISLWDDQNGCREYIHLPGFPSAVCLATLYKVLAASPTISAVIVKCRQWQGS